MSLDRTTLAKVDRLVSEGREALAKGQLDDARTKFIQALAFDGGSVAARDGLVEVDRIVQSHERIQEENDRRRRAAVYQPCTIEPPMSRSHVETGI